jgi:hypothetical protein
VLLVRQGTRAGGAQASSGRIVRERAARLGGFQVDIRAPKEVNEGEPFEVSCDVRGNSDPNVRYSWSASGSGPKLSIPRNYTPSLTLTAPDAISDYDLRLAVRVGVGTEAVTKEATLHVAADDDPPTAELVAPSACECGELVALVGQAHNEILQGVTVEWRQIGEGPRVQFEGADRLQASFVAPEHAGPYELALELHVRDGTHPDHVESAKIAVECDPSAAPLSAGEELALASDVGVRSPLPRGHWEIAGTLEFAPIDDSKPALALLRFESPKQAGALALSSDGKELMLSTRGFSRDADSAPWIEPEWNGGQVLGPWPPGVALGFAFESSGRDVSVRFGPPVRATSGPTCRRSCCRSADGRSPSRSTPPTQR